MANNCLVTKLKSSVDNENLDYLNMLSMNYNSDSGNFDIYSPGTFSVIGTTFTDGTTTHNNNVNDTILTPGTWKLLIPKYSIDTFKITNTHTNVLSKSLNVEDFKYSTKIRTFIVSSIKNGISGNIKDLGTSMLRDLGIFDTDIEGDLLDIAQKFENDAWPYNSPLLTLNKNITGDLIDFAEYLKDKPISKLTNLDFCIYSADSPITVNGKPKTKNDYFIRFDGVGGYTIT